MQLFQWLREFHADKIQFADALLPLDAALNRGRLGRKIGVAERGGRRSWDRELDRGIRNELTRGGHKGAGGGNVQGFSQIQENSAVWVGRTDKKRNLQPKAG